MELQQKMSRVVQYVIVRSDLLKTMEWPVGAVIAQACHACVAVIQQFYNDEYTQMYFQDLDNMHKVVLAVPSDEKLKQLHEELTKNSIDHKLWIEQPEGIPTCIAVKPYPKDTVQKYFKGLKLYS